MSIVKNISISKNRVAVTINNLSTIQFVIWDLKEEMHTSLEHQLNLAFSCFASIDSIVAHLKVNGFDAEFEDVY